MKLNKLSAVVAAAAALSAGSAFAGLTINDPVDLEIKISGASASDKAFFDVFSSLCTPGSLTVFTDRCSNESGVTPAELADCSGAAGGPALPGKSYAGYFCTMDNASAGISEPKNVLVRKRSSGGSFWGTVPVATADDTVAQMVIDGSNCQLAATDTYKCDKNVTETTTSDAGISDEEPELFTSVNVATGSSPMTPALRGQLDVLPIAALTFGIPVTNALYAALQEAQGLNADLDNDGTPEGNSENASAADIIANMPSLSKEQVAALMKGSIPEWSNVQYGGTPLTTLASTGPSDSRVAICRRVNGSGTQAQLNANFLNVPCTSAADLPAVDNTLCTTDKGQNSGVLPFCTAGYDVLTAVPAGAAVVHENSGSGDVTECLDQLQDANRWAIGVQSLEKDSSKWSFIKINGVEPTLEQVAKGNYFDWAATTIQWRNTTVAGVAPPAGDMLTILNAIRDEAGQAAVLDTLNDNVDQGFGPTGYLGLGTAAGATLSPFNPDVPVMQYTRDGKTCNIQRAIGVVDFN